MDSSPCWVLSFETSADESSSCRFNIPGSGRWTLCSGRNIVLTCSSVVRAFAIKMARENVARKLHAFMASLRKRHCLLSEVISGPQASFNWRFDFVADGFYITKQEVSHISNHYIFCCVFSRIITKWFWHHIQLLLTNLSTTATGIWPSHGSFNFKGRTKLLQNEKERPKTQQKILSEAEITASFF